MQHLVSYGRKSPSDAFTFTKGSALEVTALGRRIYPLEGPRTASSNKTRTAGGDAIVNKMRAKLGLV